MYNFAYETPAYTDETSRYDENTFSANERQFKNLGLSIRSLGSMNTKREVEASMRLVLPRGFADTALLAYDRAELSQGWEVAQASALVADVFGDMFAEGRNYDEIATLAADWLHTLHNELSDEDIETLETLHKQLCGVNEVARQGARQEVVKWWPTREGQTCEPSPKLDEAPSAEAGKWYEARALDKSMWRVRKRGEVVEAEQLDARFNRSLELTKEQARKSFKIVARHEPAA